MDRDKLSWEAEVLLQSLSTKDKKSSELQAETGMDRRTLMFAVRELRMAGYYLCSGNDGYHLWDGKDNTWAITKNKIRSQAFNMLELYSAMNGKQIDGQLMMDI